MADDVERNDGAGNPPAEVTSAAPPRAKAQAHEDDSLRLRACALIFVAVFAFTIAWLYPSNWGFSEFVALMLLAVSFVTSWIVVFQVGQLLVDEPATEVFRALLGQRLSVRSKSRFLQRLQHECTDAQLRTRNRGFSLVVMRFPSAIWSPGFEQPLPDIIEIVRSRVRSRDVLGDLGSGELWVLALGTGADAAESLTNRLSAAITREVPQLPAPVRYGWSTFAVDAHDVKHLLAAARSRAGYGDPEIEEQRAAA